MITAKNTVRAIIRIPKLIAADAMYGEKSSTNIDEINTADTHDNPQATDHRAASDISLNFTLLNNFFIKTHPYVNSTYGCVVYQPTNNVNYFGIK